MQDNPTHVYTCLLFVYGANYWCDQKEVYQNPVHVRYAHTYIQQAIQ